MTNRVRGETAAVRISFPPTETVRIDAPTMRRLHEEGLGFRQEIERRSAAMFVATPSEVSTKMR
jgi:hypothetical protein